MSYKKFFPALIFLALCLNIVHCTLQREMAIKPNGILVLMSDFGLSERFVASMKGVALGIDPNLKIEDLTHLIAPFNIWEAAHTLAGTVAFWPEGTVFVSVVDPGVGTTRKSVVALTQSGHFIVTPDNGTLTLVAEELGISTLREIDEAVNRRPGSARAHTFHGRDVYAYTGARLAAGKIAFEQVGPVAPAPPLKLSYQSAVLSEGGLVGSIVKIEKPFGNLVTNIPAPFAEELTLDIDRGENLRVQILKDNDLALDLQLPFVKSFGFVAEGEPLLYVDSNGMLGAAINGGNFAEQFEVGSGPGWTVQVSKQ